MAETRMRMMRSADARGAVPSATCQGFTETGWRYADLEKLKEALEGLLCTPRGRSVLKGMPARRKGKKRQGEDNCPHQRNYLETLLDGSLCHRRVCQD